VRPKIEMIASLVGPVDRFYESQGLRLHYADWGNDAAPPLILIHGGRDHCRSWDEVARALQPHFHVMAPDLRGHGDSDWAIGSSYSLSDYVYDLTRLVRSAAVDKAAIVGHSMGGMIGLMYAGTYSEKVGRYEHRSRNGSRSGLRSSTELRNEKIVTSAALPKRPSEFRRTTNG